MVFNFSGQKYILVVRDVKMGTRSDFMNIFWFKVYGIILTWFSGNPHTFVYCPDRIEKPFLISFKNLNKKDYDDILYTICHSLLLYYIMSRDIVFPQSFFGESLKPHLIWSDRAIKRHLNSCNPTFPKNIGVQSFLWIFWQTDRVWLALRWMC